MREMLKYDGFSVRNLFCVKCVKTRMVRQISGWSGKFPVVFCGNSNDAILNILKILIISREMNKDADCPPNFLLFFCGKSNDKILNILKFLLFVPKI